MHDALKEFIWPVAICVLAVGIILVGLGVLAKIADKFTGEGKHDEQDNK